MLSYTQVVSVLGCVCMWDGSVLECVHVGKTMETSRDEDAEVLDSEIKLLERCTVLRYIRSIHCFKRLGSERQKRM
jgi:hypothetical protein